MSADKAAVARLWTAAMSSKAAGPLKALAAVLEPEVRTASIRGKDKILEWFKSYPGMAMFRTGSWGEPSVNGDIVTIPITFDPRASYHGATVSITVTSAGMISRANATIVAAPDPLGSVIHRVWGPRFGTEELGAHLEGAHGVEVTKVTQLQQGNQGVFRLDLASGRRWVARVFPADRPLSGAQGDAAILDHLAEAGIPSERRAAEVTEHHGQGVLVTDFIEGKAPPAGAPTQRRLGELVGVVQSLDAPEALRRPAGGLHLYTADCTLGSEIATARECLHAGSFRGTDEAWDRLMEGLDQTSDLSGLPLALMHPDPGIPNARIHAGEIALIDWAGAGYGPRVLGIALVLGATVTGATFKRDLVDAIMSGYREHVTLTPDELGALDQAVAHRLLIHEVYAWCVGMSTKRQPGSFKAWPHKLGNIAKMSAYVRERWA